MEGVLWKWTNYWNGWQTRWFVLDSNSGVLAYYKSAEEASQGCKGSVNVSVCQINVHSVDQTRLDLVIPGEQHMYLRAPSPQERQKWLVALGSAKACIDMNIGETKSHFNNPNSIHHKKSELKLYCDLLMQQVHAIKSAANVKDGPEKMMIEEASGLLTATCDTFIKTLEEIMKMSNTSAISAPSPAPYELVIPNTSLLINGIPQLERAQSQLGTSHKVLHTSLTRSLSQENR